MLLPDEAIAVLAEAKWDPNAEREYDIMSDGFLWSDEGLREAARICIDQDNWAFRFLVGYRATLIRGEPRAELSEPWNQLLLACPEWPGFRPERIDPSLREALDLKADQSMQQIDRLCEVYDRAERIKAIRENRKKRWWQFW